MPVDLVFCDDYDIRIPLEQGVPFVDRTSVTELRGRRCLCGQIADRESVLRRMPTGPADPMTPQQLPPGGRIRERRRRNVQRQRRNVGVQEPFQPARRLRVRGSESAVARQPQIRDHQTWKRLTRSPAPELLIDVFDDDDRLPSSSSLQPALENLRHCGKGMPRVRVPAVTGQDDDVFGSVAEGHVGTVQWIALSDQYG